MAEAKEQRGASSAGQNSSPAKMIHLTGADASEVAYLYGLTGKMREGLQKMFPDCWAVIYTLAMLPVLNGSRGRQRSIEEQYQHSALSQLYKLQINKNNLSEFFSAISLAGGSISDYMRFMREDTALIGLINGHKRDCILKSTNRALRLCSQSEGFSGIPQYYWQTRVSESNVELTQLNAKAEGIALEKITIVAEQKDLSADDANYLKRVQCGYIIGLRQGSREMQKLLQTTDPYDGAFSDRGKEVQHRTVKSDDGTCKTLIYLPGDAPETAESNLAARAYLDREDAKLRFRDNALIAAENEFHRATAAMTDANQKVLGAEGDLLISPDRIRAEKERVESKKGRLQMAQQSLQFATPKKREYAEGVAARAAENLKNAEADLAAAEAHYSDCQQHLAAAKENYQAAFQRLTVAERQLLRRQIAVDATGQLMDAADQKISGRIRFRKSAKTHGSGTGLMMPR